MSNQAYSACLAARLDGDRRHPGPKAVLLYLADACNAKRAEDWSCYPSIETIADDLDMGVRTVERHLVWLQAKKWIARQRQRYAAGKLKGKLAGYRYRLNRGRLEAALAEKLARQAAERQAAGFASDPADWAEDEGPDGVTDGRAELPANLAGSDGGQAANLAGATRQSGASLPANLAGQEPEEEPEYKPKTGACARTDDGSIGRSIAGSIRAGFERCWLAYPDSGRTGRSSRDGEAWPAWLAEVGKLAGLLGVEPVEAGARLAAAVEVACRTPKRICGASGDAMALHRWLALGRYEAWLAAGPGRAAPPTRAPFADAEIRAAVVAARGEAFAASYLDPAGWDGARRTLTARTLTAFRKLSEPTLSAALRGAAVAPPAATETPVASPLTEDA